MKEKKTTTLVFIKVRIDFFKRNIIKLDKSLVILITKKMK